MFPHDPVETVTVPTRSPYSTCNPTPRNFSCLARIQNAAAALSTLQLLTSFVPHQDPSLSSSATTALSIEG